MKQVYWNDKFEIGIPELDEQHQTLIELINQLSSAISRADVGSIIQQRANKLTHYLALHFRDEEQVIMQCASMPETEKHYHYQQHEMFDQHVQSLMDSSNLDNLSFAKDLLDYISTWLISHILGVDRRLASFVQRDIEGLHVEIEDEETTTVSQVERILLAALNESERRFRLFSDDTPILMWISDNQGRRTFFNQAWQDYLQDKTTLMNNEWQKHIHPDDLTKYLVYQDQLKLNRHSGEIEYRIRAGNGQYRFFYERIMPRFELDHTFIGHTGSAVDVTHLKEAEFILSRNNEALEIEVKKRAVELQQLMKLDPLTNVSNREYLMEMLEAEMKRSKRHNRPLSLLHIHLDDFTKVKNDIGYTDADEILKLIAQTVNARIRESDIFGRYGVESFLAVLPESNLEDAQSFAELIRNHQDMLDHPLLEQPITLSIGVAQLIPTESIFEWTNRCQDAMLLARENGGNQIIRG